MKKTSTLRPKSSTPLNKDIEYYRQLRQTYSNTKEKSNLIVEPRFSNSNKNGSKGSKKILSKNIYQIQCNLWDLLLNKTIPKQSRSFSNTPLKINNRHEPIVKNLEKKKKNTKKSLSIIEFDEAISKASFKNDFKIEQLKKCIFKNYSNQKDIIGEDKPSFLTEKQTEFIRYDEKEFKKYDNLLLTYKLERFETENNVIDKALTIEKKNKKPLLGKRPDFIKDLQKSSFYLFK